MKLNLHNKHSFTIRELSEKFVLALQSSIIAVVVWCACALSSSLLSFCLFKRITHSTNGFYSSFDDDYLFRKRETRRVGWYHMKSVQINLKGCKTSAWSIRSSTSNPSAFYSYIIQCTKKHFMMTTKIISVASITSWFKFNSCDCDGSGSSCCSVALLCLFIILSTNTIF